MSAVPLDNNGSPDPAATDPGTTQDVRFAVAMSGGVSLAVWMGGVAREVNLLQQASRSPRRDPGPADPGPGRDEQAARPSPGGPGSTTPGGWDALVRDRYRRLLDCLDLTVTVDVLAGTSAGGVNAALLGLSSAAGADLALLRDLWLTTGSMDLLLRDPGEPRPPSLMQGDKVLFSQLARGIEGFWDRRPAAGEPYAPATPPDTTVFITTTMMSGETSRVTDDYGTVVPDVDHHGLFTFHEKDLAPDPQDRTSLTALALAARCSASFPGAFEPSFVPVHGTVTGVPGVPPRPDMADFANMTRSHWVADGGLLANRPIAPLLSTVFSRRATREVRRVLAFVVPDGGVTAHAGQSPPADEWGKPPTLVQALKLDLDAQLSQSIASELQLIRAHNDQLSAASELRRALADLGARLQPGGLVTPGVLADYQVQQGRGLAGPLLSEIMRAVSTLDRLPKGWDTALLPASLSATSPQQEQLTTAMATLLGAGWNPAALDAGPAGGEILRDEAAASAAWESAPDPVSQAARFGLPVLRAAHAVVMHLIRLGYQRAVDPGQRRMLDGYHADITAALDGLPAGSDDELDVARAVREGAAPAGGRPAADLSTLARGLADQKRRILLIGPGRSVLLASAWGKLATAAVGLIRDLAPLAVAEGRASRREAAKALATYRAYLGSAVDPATMTSRLLNLMIAERALQPAQPVIDQPVEFIQVSANTRTSLSPQQDTVNKLRGVELHHFAAFYKSSWRAYDWMWGRLDGSGWLVHILLDPRRILAVIENRYDWPREQRARNFAALLRQAAGLPDGLPGDCLERDLDFLSHADATIPVSLPSSALFLARAWQEPIAANELPAVAERMAADDGHLPPAASPPAAQHLRKPPDPWVTRVLGLKDTKRAGDLAALLPSCPVRLETLAGQERTPAFLQTATKAAAVATAALTVAPEVPKPIRPILTSARAVTRTGYLATKAIGGNGLKTLLAGLALAIVGIVLATQGTVIIGLTGTVLALTGLYLIALGAWGIHRGLLGALIAFTALLAVGALTLPWVRTELWGTNGSAKNGLVPRDALPWLRTTWWAGLTVLGGIILVAVLLSLLPRSRAPRNRGQENPAGPPPAERAGAVTSLPSGSAAAGEDGSPAADQDRSLAGRDAALR